jgi:disulfide oxidoreductase YuzD
MYQICKRENYGWKLLYTTSSFERARFLSGALENRYPNQMFKVFFLDRDRDARKQLTAAYT